MNNSELENRTVFFKDILCSEFNAIHYQDKNIIKSKFALSDKDLSEIKESNVLSGTHDEYEYNILEYSLISNTDKNYYLMASVKIPDKNFPEFELVPKWSGLIKKAIICILTLPFLLLFLLSFFYISSWFAAVFIHSEEILKETTTSNLIKSFFKSLIFLGMLYIPSHIFSKSISKIKDRLFQGKYGIKNAEFNSRYAFDNVKDANSIKRVFTPKVCSNIVNFTPQLSNIKSKNNYLIITANGIITNTENCKAFIEYCINQAKIFSNNDRF